MTEPEQVEICMECGKVLGNVMGAINHVREHRPDGFRVTYNFCRRP